MNVVTRRHLTEARGKYQDAAKEIEAWYKVANTARWHNFAEVKQAFADASVVDDYVIFNIRGNKYRLVTAIHYEREKEGERRGKQGHIYIRSFLTHKEYDTPSNWDKGGF
jgi:mRNA interferase HigB